MYGVSFPNDWVIGPPMVGPTAHPNPKIVSYAPIIFPDMPFFVLLKIISNVNGKNMLNPNPIKTRAIPNMMIESATTDIANPIETASVAAIKVWLVFFANFPANASEST